MSPAQCCRSSTEPLEEQILRAEGAAPAPSHSSEGTLCPQNSRNLISLCHLFFGESPKALPSSLLGARELCSSPGSRSLPFPTAQESQGVPGGKEGGWLTFCLLFWF